MPKARILSLVLVVAAVAAGSAEGRLAQPGPALGPDSIFPERSDVEVMEWTATDVLRWEMVVRTSTGHIYRLSQRVPAKDRWVAQVTDESSGWWARYTMDLGLDDEALAELSWDWLDGDWSRTLGSLDRQGRLHVTHRIETRDGIDLSHADTGRGSAVRELGRGFSAAAEGRLEAGAEEAITELLDLALVGYFQKTVQLAQLLSVLSGGQLDSETILGIRRRFEGRASGTSTSEDTGGTALMGDPGDDPSPQAQFCNGDPDHYAHDYPSAFDLCTKEHNPHYPSYRIPPHCAGEPGCAACNRRTKNIGACCSCCDAQYAEKTNCDCWIGSYGGCEVLAQATRLKCKNEGCQAGFLAECT